ncbi:MAG: exodeoxyribonuclease III [Calditrichia bacterium]
MPKKLVSWNVNGLRAAQKKGFAEFLDREQPDIISIQETKAQPEQVELPLDGYKAYWNSAERRGYSGTLTLTRIEPLSVASGLGDLLPDNEGRVQTLEFNKFFLVNVYTPNAKRDLSRLDYRQEWDRIFLEYLHRLEARKPVIFCGDLNVAHQEIDLANPKSNRGNAGFTDEERAGIDRIFRNGYLDSFREFVKEGGHYSWWSYMGRAREKNIGWRIDYFGISEKLRPYLQNVFILPEVMGSDHCPVGIEVQDQLFD